MTAKNPLILANTLLGIFHARHLYIADEIRVDSLRRIWLASGSSAEDFERAVRFLTAGGFLRQVESGRSAGLRLTRKGYEAIQQPVTARRYQEAAPPPRQVRIRPAAPTRIESAMPRFADAAASSDPQIAKARLFREQHPHLSAAVVQHLIFGLFKQANVPAGKTVRYQHFLDAWQQMRLPETELVGALDRMVAQGFLQTAADGSAALRLTHTGRKAILSEPQTIQDGLERAQARRYLRLTKRLGELRKAG